MTLFRTAHNVARARASRRFSVVKQRSQTIGTGNRNNRATLTVPDTFSVFLFRIRELESILTVTLSNKAAEIKAFTFVALLDDGKAVFYYDTDGELLARIGGLTDERFRVEIMPDFLQLSGPHCKSRGKAIKTDLDELTGQVGTY